MKSIIQNTFIVILSVTVMACDPGYVEKTSDISERRISTARYPQLGDTPTIEKAGSEDSLTADTQPVIKDVSTNEADFPNNQIPRYETLEITFQIDTPAENLQLPYDSTPPSGIAPEIGISVDALFTPDDWRTVYTQPAFYYQEFISDIKGGKEWYYPTGQFSWKVRFTPDAQGTWNYKIIAKDRSGTSETPANSFIVVPSNLHGFVRVSQRDARYFEFEDGTYFPGLGYNMNYDHVSWYSPILDNQTNFEIMSRNGIQLVRIWLSQWGIYTSAWNPWNSIDPNLHAQYIPYAGLTFEQAYPGSEISMQLSATDNPCMFIGAWKAPPALKRDSQYRVRIRYKTTDIAGPTADGNPYGLVAKVGGWLWGDGDYCQDSGSGSPVTPYQPSGTSGWQILEGSFNAGDNDFLPNFYLALENVSQGEAYIDYIWIEEDLGNGNFGPNIVSKPWMAHHLYLEQRNSYAFDRLLDLAEQYGIYLRPVILEKNEWILNRISYDGTPIPDDPLCWDSDPSNDPALCPGNQWFYGNGRELTKTRWLQRAWWRYLQARWGYSTHIHSWELLNEGDPWDSLHYTLADEFGKYMHQFRPDDHLVSTSFWHSFPKDEFWANPEYSNVDFADYHRYINESEPGFLDTTLATMETSLQLGAYQIDGAGKPVIRGETGFVVSGTAPPTAQFDADTGGVWLHNFIWGGINPGGLLESYWYENTHIYRQDNQGGLLFDHRSHYAAFYNFVQDISLNNGYYQDAQASVSNEGLRVLGQKDLIAGRAHLWIQNKSHTWKNVVDQVQIPELSGNVTVSGFRPGQEYTLTWWDPYESDLGKQIIRTSTVHSQGDGSITLRIDHLSQDIAARIDVSRQVHLPIIQLPARVPQ
jgi:hypothetical protein